MQSAQFDPPTARIAPASDSTFADTRSSNAALTDRAALFFFLPPVPNRLASRSRAAGSRAANASGLAATRSDASAAPCLPDSRSISPRKPCNSAPDTFEPPSAGAQQTCPIAPAHRALSSFERSSNSPPTTPRQLATPNALAAAGSERCFFDTCSAKRARAARRTSPVPPR